MGAVAFQAMAEELVGRPTPGGIGLQVAASPLKEEAHFFHDYILLPIIVAISLFVLALLVICVVRFNKKANPVPARFSHNTFIEVLWTVLPVLILAGIAVFSMRLLVHYYDMPKPDLTIKATGYQWNWGYEYPDHGIPEYISNILPEDQLAGRGYDHSYYRLAATEPLVVPVGKVVRVLTTGGDVIHAFALPAFGVKIDAIPGRINEQWFKAEKIGQYFGQCSELCGVDHAFMPIQINVVTQEEFEAWVASKGGKLPGAAPVVPVAAAETASTAEASPAAAALPAPAPAAGTDPAAPPAAAH